MPPLVTPAGAQPSEEHRRSARASAAAWAAALLRRHDVVFLDTETTGLDGTAEIIEIAVVDIAGRTLLDSLIRPDGRIPPDAARIHGIGDTMVAGAPRWPEVYRLLLPLIAGRTIVVYNADFDLRLVQQMNRRFGLATPDSDWQCAMRQYARFAAQWHERYGGYRWHKLDAAASRFGVPSSSHRARADALACRGVVAGMAGDT